MLGVFSQPLRWSAYRDCMLCQKCSAENSEGRRFCAQCGAPLPQPCPACGFANKPGDRFCGGCGKALGQVGDFAPPSPPASPGEHRPVTILFADLAGFTKLTTELGAEKTHALLNRQLALLDDLVTNYGGGSEYIGDAIMAVQHFYSSSILQQVLFLSKIHLSKPYQ